MIKGHFDGASRGNPGQAGAGAVIYDDDGSVLWRCARPLGECTNNEAEYQALGILTDEMHRRGFRDVLICGDSKLVISQVSGKWKIKEPRLRMLAEPIMLKLQEMNASFMWVRRENNKEADRLSNVALDEGDVVEEGGAGNMENPAAAGTDDSCTVSVSEKTPAAEKTLSESGTVHVSVARLHGAIWLVTENGDDYAVDLVHGHCTCGKSGCVHVDAVTDEVAFIKKNF